MKSPNLSIKASRWIFGITIGFLIVLQTQALFKREKNRIVLEIVK